MVRAAAVILLPFVTALSLVLPQGQTGRFVIVTADSIPLRTAPAGDAGVGRYFPATLQLRVVEVTPDSQWYKVKIGENKGYQIAHSEHYWVQRSNVVDFMPSVATVRTDVSLLEEPENQFSGRIEDNSFLDSGGSTRRTFYVSAVQRVVSFQPTCSTAFTVCARIYLPGQYRLPLLDRPDAEPLYDRLHGDGIIKPFYEVSATQRIHTIRERLTLGRVVMGRAGCYAEDYRATDVIILADTVRIVDGNKAFSYQPIDVTQLVETKTAGEVQHVNLMYELELSYSNGYQENVVRRIHISWPGCL